MASTADKDKTTPVRYDGPGSSRWLRTLQGKAVNPGVPVQWARGLGETRAPTIKSDRPESAALQGARGRGAKRPPGWRGGHNAPGLGAGCSARRGASLPPGGGASLTHTPDACAPYMPQTRDVTPRTSPHQPAESRPPSTAGRVTATDRNRGPQPLTLCSSSAVQAARAVRLREQPPGALEMDLRGLSLKGSDLAGSRNPVRISTRRVQLRQSPGRVITQATPPDWGPRRWNRG